jgi:hypothetical protein
MRMRRFNKLLKYLAQDAFTDAEPSDSNEWFVNETSGPYQTSITPMPNYQRTSVTYISDNNQNEICT